MCPDGCIHSQYEYGGLDPDLSRPVGKYTMDMWQRLGIAQATMEYPNLLIFDEPMNSLIMSGRIITEENVRIAKEQVIWEIANTNNKKLINTGMRSAAVIAVAET